MPERTERVCCRDVGRRREAILVLDQQPLVLLLGAHQRERALELLAAQQDAELALRRALRGPRAPPARGRGTRWLPVFVRRVDAAVPDDHLAGAVLARRNHAFERRVVVRVILGLHGEPLFATIERRTLRHRPGLEHAVAFEPEVVVQRAWRNAAGRRTAAGRSRRTHRRRRLGRGREGPLGRVFL